MSSKKLGEIYLKSGEIKRLLGDKKIIEKFDRAIKKLTLDHEERCKMFKFLYATKDEDGIYAFSKFAEEPLYQPYDDVPIGIRKREDPRKIAEDIKKFCELMNRNYLLKKEIRQVKEILFELIPGGKEIKDIYKVDVEYDKNEKKARSIINDIVDDYYNFNIHQYGSKVFEKCMCDDLPCPQDKYGKKKHVDMMRKVNKFYVENLHEIVEKWYFIMQHVLCYRIAERKRVCAEYKIEDKMQYVEGGWLSDVEQTNIAFRKDIQIMPINKLCEIMGDLFGKDEFQIPVISGDFNHFKTICSAYMEYLFQHPLKEIAVDDYDFLISKIFEDLEVWNNYRHTVGTYFVQMNDYLSYVEDLRGSKFHKSMINDWMKGGEEHTVEELEKNFDLFFHGN